MKELQLRMRGLPEEQGEDIREMVLNILSELTEKGSDEIQIGLDQVYRLKSKYAGRQEFPQDVIINCLSKTLKEEVLKQSYDNPIEVKGKRVSIMKELPRQVLLQRKMFKNLMDGGGA